MNPTWAREDEEFRCMNGPSGAVPVAALIDAEEAVAEAEARAQRLSQTVPGGTRLRERIEAAVVEAAARLRGGDRRSILRDAVSRLRAEYARPRELQRTAGLADRLACAYGSLLLEEFRAEFDVEFAAENPSAEIAWKEAEKAARDAERLKTAVTKARKEVEPNLLRQHLRFDPGDALGVLRRFVKTWRRRAEQFAVPVTIHGVRIDTLPESDRAEWTRCWTKCGCRTGGGESPLVPQVAVRPPEPPAEPPRTVGAMFAKEKP